MSNELLHNSDVSQVLRAMRRTYTAVHAQTQAARGEKCARATTAALAVARVKTIVTILSPKSAIQPALITRVRQVKGRPITAYQIGDRSSLFKAARSDDV
jgi:hypothetical protein